MPNWCGNEIKISGKREHLKKVAEVLMRAKELGSLFNFIYPTPDELKDTTSPSPKTHISLGDSDDAPDNWFDWRIENWGTKWDLDFDETAIEVGDHCIYMSFDTAWSPPTSFFKKFSADFKVEVEMRYLEEALFYVGRTVYQNGQVIVDDSVENPQREDIERFGFDTSDIFDY